MTQIRMATADDAAGIRAIYAPHVLDAPTSFERSPPTEADVGERIRTTTRTHPWLVCEHVGEIVGYAYAGRHRSRDAYQWSADVSVYVHSEYQRHGVARGLYESLFRALTLQGYYNLYAGITLPNASSVGLHEAMGFEPVGVYENVGYKHGEWRDVGWWARSLRSHEPDPDPPQPVIEVRETREWDDALSTGLSAISL